MAKNKKKKKKNILYNIAFLLALVVFLFSAYKLGSIYYLNYQESKEKKAVQDIANIPEQPQKDKVNINWKALKEKNPQIIGWIYIPDTEISYPIVQGDDNAYYLTHTFEKKENYAGAIFLDANANKDLKDRNTMIYGHNVKHGTMFAELEKFKEEKFFKDHPYIYIYTEKQNYRSEVFSMYSTTADSASYNINYRDDKDFMSYIDMIKKESDFKREVKVKENDRIISLSTCSYERGGKLSDMRYLLHAKLVKWNP